MQNKLNNIELNNQKFNHELSILKQTNQKISTEKKKLEESLEQAKIYSRKLESKLIQGNKGNVFTDINKKIKQDIEQLKEENVRLLSKSQLAEVQLEKALNDLNVYIRALELKADEFVAISGMTGLDIKATLLYDVG